MCGRFAFVLDTNELQEMFPGIDFEFSHPPRYNVAPWQEVTAILNTTPNEARPLQWGLVPSWFKGGKMSYRMINARRETLTQKPSFRILYQKRRCLIPASGYYEWKKESSTKIPYYFRMKTRLPFSFAGLWERWQSEEETILSCAIITTQANELVSQIHHRMPVILKREKYEEWLNPNTQERDRLNTLTRPYPSRDMESFPVSTLVNNPRNEDPSCILPEG